MPVQRFRTIADMPDAPWRAPGDPALYRAVARVWATSRRLAPRTFPRGVFRHRTMESLDRQREEWARRDGQADTP